MTSPVSHWLVLVDRYHYAILGAALVLMLVIGLLAPRRTLGPGRWKRWAVNLILAGLGLALIEAAFPAILQLARTVSQALHLPAIARMGLPIPILVIVSLLLLDLMAYAVHLLSHQAPWLWRLHKVHHSDTEFDATTGVLHHPLEVLIVTVIQILVMAILGLPLLVIILYGVLSNVHPAFAHANIRLPTRVDRFLRLLIVTPDMHRVHHSVRLEEGNSNFGMLFPWWDRLFGSYRQDMAEDQATARLGLPGDGDTRTGGLLNALLLPLRRSVSVH